MKKYGLPLNYAYKTGAAEIEMVAHVFDEMVLQLRAGEERADCREKGGILGCDEKGVITRFYYDSEGVGDRTSYRPDTESLQRVLQRWNAQQIRFAGVIHTHTREDAVTLSPKDLRFAKALLMLNPQLERIIMAILVRGGKLILYAFDRDYAEDAADRNLPAAKEKIHRRNENVGRNESGRQLHGSVYFTGKDDAGTE